MSTKINGKVAQRLGVRRFDASEYLRDEADIAAYLEAAATEEDARVLAAALGDVARARGMSELARKTGLTLRCCTNRSPPKGTLSYRP